MHRSKGVLYWSAIIQAISFSRRLFAWLCNILNYLVIFNRFFFYKQGLKATADTCTMRQVLKGHMMDQREVDGGEVCGRDVSHLKETDLIEQILSS